LLQVCCTCCTAASKGGRNIAGPTITALALAGANMNEEIEESGGLTALHYAAGFAPLEIVVALLEGGVTNVNGGNVNGEFIDPLRSPFHIAVTLGRPEIVRTLLEAGADLEMHLPGLAGQWENRSAISPIAFVARETAVLQLQAAEAHHKGGASAAFKLVSYLQVRIILESEARWQRQSTLGKLKPIERIFWTRRTSHRDCRPLEVLIHLIGCRNRSTRSVEGAEKLPRLPEELWHSFLGFVERHLFVEFKPRPANPLEACMRWSVPSWHHYACDMPNHQRACF
jgi:hypothetical protein